MRAAERVQQPERAAKRQIDDLGMKLRQPVEDGSARSAVGRSPAGSRVHRCVLGGHGGDRLGLTVSAGSARRRRRAAPRQGHDLGGGIRRQQVEHADQRVAQLLAVDDHVDHAVLQQVFGALEALRQLLADRVLDHARRRRSRSCAPGSAIWMSPSMAKEAVTPPVVGIGQHDDVGQARFLDQRTAMVLRGICISDRMPSCMRAPPDGGERRSAALPAARPAGRRPPAPRPPRCPSSRP